MAELVGLAILDTLPEDDYDQFTRLASEVCDTPIALVSLLDKDRQWFKSRIGMDVCETGRAEAFCPHAILTPDEVMLVPDALKDERFAENPLVVGPPHIRFYAGAPIVLDSGLPMGTLCVMDTRPRELHDWQVQTLRLLAKRIVRLLQQRRPHPGHEA
ncbi:GAF domain-containing protein [Caldimonas tepidiphila]|uniref:GAF domain-containing protein n=1 Tax=Caldimonas tepidiphila TaxID=2315841 RepID=UPI0013009E87|nr:GAF domain-containing protein [Caldimonas tepidiphila]